MSDGLLARLLPHDASCAETREDHVPEVLHPSEEAVIARAVQKRRVEFTAVRHCARVAMDRMGIERPPLVPGDAGAPVWPSGIVGSMTHCAGYRAAAVARSDRIVALGIDAEPDDRLPDGVLDAVSSSRERAHLSQMARMDRGPHWDRILFSAKESVYKTWYPLARRWLGFEDAEIEFLSGGHFRASLSVSGLSVDQRPLHTLEGRWLATDGLILTAIALTRRPVNDPDIGECGDRPAIAESRMEIEGNVKDSRRNVPILR